MTDLTKELNRSQGIPFLEYKHFVTRTFFPKVRRQRVSRAPHCSQICSYQVRALLKGFYSVTKSFHCYIFTCHIFQPELSSKVELHLLGCHTRSGLLAHDRSWWQLFQELLWLACLGPLHTSSERALTQAECWGLLLEGSSVTPLHSAEAEGWLKDELAIREKGFLSHAGCPQEFPVAWPVLRSSLDVSPPCPRLGTWCSQ